MNGVQCLILAAGLAADAFAVSIIRGMTAVNRRTDWILTAMFFAAAQTIMPAAGYFLGIAVAGSTVRSGGKAVSAAILCLIGGKMLLEDSRDEEKAAANGQNGCSLLILSAQALATAIDAMAAGIGLYAGGARLWPTAGIIGAVTGLFCLAGHRLGSRCSTGRWGGVAQRAGGIALIALAVRTWL